MTGPRIGRRGLFGATTLAALIAGAPKAFAQMLGYPRCLEGPMVGPGGPDHITIWARISGAFEVVVEASPDRYFKAPIKSAPVTASADNDFCVVMRVAASAATRLRRAIRLPMGWKRCELRSRRSTVCKPARRSRLRCLHE